MPTTSSKVMDMADPTKDSQTSGASERLESPQTKSGGLVNPEIGSANRGINRGRYEPYEEGARVDETPQSVDEEKVDETQPELRPPHVHPPPGEGSDDDDRGRGNRTQRAGRT
jgi:hypothetical protein